MNRIMRRLVPVLLVLGLIPASAALGSPAATRLRIQHRDPGCHWIVRHGKYLKRAVVRGPVKLANFDIKTLRVKPTSGKAKLLNVGKTITLKHGTYRITMVRQEKEDNHLKLVVR